MMQGIAWEKEYHEIMKKAQVKLSFGSTGNHGDLVMGFVSNLVLLVFYDLFELDLWVLIVSGVRPCHFVCDVVLLLVFRGFLLGCFRFLPFYVLRELVGKEES